MLAKTFDNVVNYLEYLFGYFGRIICQELMESLALAKLQKDIVLSNWMNQSRVGKNVLITGPHGFFKTTILRIIYGLIKDNKELHINRLTSLSVSALRGSISESRRKKTFYPPEAKVSDIIINYELSTLDVEDKELTGNLQSLLEDGTVRYALIKFANPSVEIIEEAKQYGVTFEDGRLCYKGDASLWTSTHTTDFLPASLKKTFIDRFVVVEVPKYLSKGVFNPEFVLDVIFKKKRNYVFEGILASKIQQTLKNISITKEEFELASAVAEEVLRETLKSNINIKLVFNARLVSEVLKSAIAFLAWHPKATRTELKEYMKDKPLRYSQAKLPLDDILTDLLESSPKTMKELIESTGAKRTTILWHLTTKLHAKEHPIKNKKLWSL